MERLASRMGDTFGWGKWLSPDTCGLALAPEFNLIDLFSFTSRKAPGTGETFVCGHSFAPYVRG